MTWRPWARVAVACAPPLLGVLPLYALTTTVAAAEEGAAAATTLIATAVAVFFGVAVAASAGVARLLQQAQVQRATAAALCATAAASALLMASVNKLVVVLAMAIAAVGHAVAQASSNVIIVEALPVSRRATGLGLKQATVPAAALLAGASLPIVGPAVGAGATFACIGILSLLALPAVAWASGGLVRASTPGDDLLDLLRRRPGTGTVFGVFLATFLASVPGNLAAVFLVPSQVAAGLDAAVAGLLLMAGSLSAMLTRVVLGVAADRGRLPVDTMAFIAVLLLTAAPGYVLLGHGAALPLETALVVLLFMAGWGWNGLLVHELVRRHPGWTYRVGGAVHAGVYLGSALSPTAFAVIVARWSYTTAWSATGCCAVIGGLLLLTIRAPAAAPGFERIRGEVAG